MTSPPDGLPPDDLLVVENLTKHFPIKGGGVIHAVNGVSLLSVVARPSASSASPVAASPLSPGCACGW